MNDSNKNLITSSNESRVYETFNLVDSCNPETWEGTQTTYDDLPHPPTSPIEMRASRHSKSPKLALFSPKRATTRFGVRSPKKIKSTSSGIRLSSQSASSFNSRSRTKSVSSFGRLTSFMAGSPRPPIKYNSKFKPAYKSRKDAKQNERTMNARTPSFDSSYRCTEDDLSISQYLL